MKPNKYIISIINTENEKAQNLFFSTGQGILVFLTLSIIFLITSSLGLRYLKNQSENHKITLLQKENTVLKKTFESWDMRTRKIETVLTNLQKSNNAIRIAAALPASKIEFGIGGPESSVAVGMIAHPEVTKKDLRLNQIETELEFLKQNMLELEGSITTRSRQIAHFPSIRPIRGGWISSPFGERIDPFTGQIETHRAIDISTRPGTEVFSTAAGVVEFAQTTTIKNKGYGKFIIINHGYGYKTIYAHLSKVLVIKGQKIKRWDLIGLSGNTGKSTAPHLHYEVLAHNEQKNPMDFMLE